MPASVNDTTVFESMLDETQTLNTTATQSGCMGIVPYDTSGSANGDPARSRRVKAMRSFTSQATQHGDDDIADFIASGLFKPRAELLEAPFRLRLYFSARVVARHRRPSSKGEI